MKTLKEEYREVEKDEREQKKICDSLLDSVFRCLEAVKKRHLNAEIDSDAPACAQYKAALEEWHQAQKVLSPLVTRRTELSELLWEEGDRAAKLDYLRRSRQIIRMTEVA